MLYRRNPQLNAHGELIHDDIGGLSNLAGEVSLAGGPVPEDCIAEHRLRALDPPNHRDDQQREESPGTGECAKETVQRGPSRADGIAVRFVQRNVDDRQCGQ